MNIPRDLYFIACGVMFLLLTSCSKDKSQLESMLENCPVQYKQNDFVEIQKYYSGIISDNNRYIGFKEFSNSGYRLVTLVNIGKRSILSISLPFYKNGTFYKDIPSNVSQEIFNKLNLTSNMEHYNGGSSFHPVCVLTINKIEKNHAVSSLYNPPITFSRQFDYKNNGIKIYATLKLLVDDYFPDFNDKIIAITMANSKSIQIGDNSFIQDNYINATNEESKVFMQKLLHQPFFELNSSEE